MMTDEQINLKEAMRQTDAIFALDGFEPDAQHIAINAAVLAGRVTLNQVAEELTAHAKQHKTVDGFIDTRAWA